MELKSVRRIIKAHEIELVNYLTATRMDVGLIINFGERKVEIRRKVIVLVLNKKLQDKQDKIYLVHPVYPV